MQFTATARCLARTGFALFFIILGGGPGAIGAVAQTELYAATELNLRQEPSLEAEVLRFIPAGAAIERTEEAEVNGYVPVVFDGVPCWAIALGLVVSPEEVEGVGGGLSPEASLAEPIVSDSEETRFTLTPLVLRDGPDPESEPILVMPEGATLTLTREGAENGYVTVDYNGTRGWAYAGLLGGDR